MDEENSRSVSVKAVSQANRSKMPRMRIRWMKRLQYSTLVLIALALLFIGYIQTSIWWVAKGKGFDDVNDIQGRYVGLVFGCDSRYQNRDNLYFTYRMDAVAKLWFQGKLRGVIVSGDNRSVNYNEPEKMRKALIQRGIPADKIIADYAGLRTLDSVVRCHKVFGIDHVLMISQRFQNERALSIAASHKINAMAFHAQDVTSRGSIKTNIREWGARVKMWLDLHVLETQPKHLGPAVPLPF